MMGLIVGVAEADPRIRAAYLEGSRADDNAPRDIVRDYDVGYVVTCTRPFIEDRAWIDRFGTRLLMQRPGEFEGDEDDPDRWYCWLMLFDDGNRLDLHVCTPECIPGRLELYRTLVDKDGVMPAAAMTGDERYWVRPPSARRFAETCNEFWWCLNNVGKGLWRGEMPYVMDMLDDPVRPMLRRMLEWRAGLACGFRASMGKSGKYMDRYLPAEAYRRYLSTYAAAEPGPVWRAVATACRLFDETAREVAAAFGFAYDDAEAEGSLRYLRRMRELPPDAAGVW